MLQDRCQSWAERTNSCGTSFAVSAHGGSRNRGWSVCLAATRAQSLTDGAACIRAKIPRCPWCRMLSGSTPPPRGFPGGVPGVDHLRGRRRRILGPLPRCPWCRCRQLGGGLLSPRIRVWGGDRQSNDTSICCFYEDLVESTVSDRRLENQPLLKNQVSSTPPGVGSHVHVRHLSRRMRLVKRRRRGR